MDWQQHAALIVVAVTVLLLARGALHRRRNRSLRRGSCADCGCGPHGLTDETSSGGPQRTRSANPGGI